MLLDRQAEDLVQKAIEMALAGDPVAVRFCLGRLIGARRGQPLLLDDAGGFPAVAGPGDLSAAVAAVTAALAEGRITPEEALDLSQMLDGFPRVLAVGRAETAPEDASEDTARAADEARAELCRRLARLAGPARPEPT